MKEELLTMLDNVIRDAAQQLINELESGDAQRIEHVMTEYHKLNYTRGQEPEADDYQDQVFCDLYLVRYGYAYAFEYSVIYDAVLRSYAAAGEEINGDAIFGLSSLACGSMIDAWGLAYAAARIHDEAPGVLPEDLRLTYHGTDMVKWAFLFAGNTEGDQTLNNCFMRRPITRELGISVEEFLRGEKNYHWLGAMCFAKFLNEVSDEIRTGIEESLRESVRNGCFAEDNRYNRREYYICISHSASSVDNNGEGEQNLSEVARRVINALNEDNVFDVNSRVMDCSPYCGKCDRNNNVTGLVSDDGEIPVYRFNAPYLNERNDGIYGSEIARMNNDFCRNTEVNDLVNRFMELMGQHVNRPRKPISRVHYSRFQVIKLTRRA